MTSYQRYTPPPPLASYVHCFWYWRGIPGPHPKERLLPNGEMSIIINLLDDKLRIYDGRNPELFTDYGDAILSGPRSDCFIIDTAQEECVIGIQFRPAGAFAFIGMPASEVENATASLPDVWDGSKAFSLRDELLSTPSVNGMFRVLERFLLRRLAWPIDPAVAHTICRLHDSNGVKLGNLADELGISQRRFIDVFRTQVGLTPKVFYRVRRFQKVLKTVHKLKEVDWADVALACGYYDQPHFIHDFRDFAGMTPAAYLAASTEHLNHVPLAG